MRKVLVPLLVLALLCLGLTTATAEGNTMKFDQSKNLVFVGETLQTVLNRSGTTAEGTLSYASSNEKTATVDENGVVTGLAKGRTTITATVMAADGKTYRTQLNVTVSKKAESIEVNTSKLSLYAASDSEVAGLLKADGEDLPVLVVPARKSANIQATVLPKDVTNRKVALTSSDESVLRVKGTTASGVSAGEVILTVASEQNPEVNLRYRVLVVQPVTRIEVKASSTTVANGEQVTLTANTLPDNATIKNVVWSSQDTSVATVDENGVVTGIKRGNARIVASSTDGSNIRANISVRVTQKATGITLSKNALTVDVGRNTSLKATVEPRNTDDKTVTWSSSDESVATVDKQGRIKGISLGTCQIICTSNSNGEVTAAASLTVQQPVTKITFDAPLSVYLGETGKLSWTVEPSNATNPAVKLTSSNNNILTVTDDGTVTPKKVGQTYVNAASTDGSNRRARVKVNVLQHVTGVHMMRKNAYIDVGETATAGAVLEPSNASNHNMSWVSEDTSIATVSGTTNRVKITGVSRGETKVVGTTEDGGYTTSIVVKVGDWDNALTLNKVESNMYGDIMITMKNRSDLKITKIFLQLEFYVDDVPVAVNKKDGSNTITASYNATLQPGADSIGYKDLEKYYRNWTVNDYVKPELGFNRLVVRITSYQIDNDWIKTIRSNHRPKKEWKY